MAGSRDFVNIFIPFQIEYVMCDKTGTLTQNRMEFRKCSVGGSVYSDPMAGCLQPHASDPEVH